MFEPLRGWSGGAMVLGKLPVPGRPTIRITLGQGPTALTVGAGGGCLDIFTLIYHFSPLSPSLWETGPLNPKQPTNIEPLKVNCYLRYQCSSHGRFTVIGDIKGRATDG